MHRFLAAALFVAALLTGSGGALAATVTVTFSGVIKSFDDPDGLTSYGNGQSITGTLTIGPLSDAPSSVTDSGSFHDTAYTAAAKLDFAPIADIGTATIETQHINSLGYFGISFQSTT